MTGLDTNVLVRYLTQDDPVQAGMAAGIIEGDVAREGQLLVCPFVILELVWVLESAYGFNREEVASTLDRILRTAQFEIPEKDVVWKAWADYRLGRGDFADYLIGRFNERLGAVHTVTFDRGLRGHGNFRVL